MGDTKMSSNQAHLLPTLKQIAYNALDQNITLIAAVCFSLVFNFVIYTNLVNGKILTDFFTKALEVLTTSAQKFQYFFLQKELMNTFL